ncbi:MAG: winged helix-turn-helix domain-containing protein [Coprobacter sp.]|nr:winged helix-turn-helix domain-containing protein [Coprobacter sp.]
MDREVIGYNAGVVWNALNDSEKKLTLKGLKRVSRLKDKELYAAMGWLSREDKISIEEIDGDLMIGLM